MLGHSGVTSQSSMATPQAVAVDNSGRLYVADDQNNRILIFNNAESKPNGANADIVLGQADFLTGTTNTGGISASTLSRPGGIVFDNAANVLWVADYANARALRYSPVGGGPTLDIDGSNAATKYDALTDGLLVLRYMFGLIGAPLTASAHGSSGGKSCYAQPPSESESNLSRR